MLLDPTHFIESVGLMGLMIVIFTESGFPFGFFLPGDTLLFAAGFLALSHPELPIWAVILCAFIAAVAGVSAGYFSGKFLEQRWFKDKDTFLFNRKRIKQAHEFYERYGAVTVILGRFIPAVRSFVPFVAGVVEMPYRKLLAYNVIGGILWAIGIPLVGYFAGRWLEQHGINIDALILPVVGAVIVLSLLVPLIHGLIDPKSRARISTRLKR